MANNELKEILKPLIKKYVRETVKEMLFEEGFLSSIIKECVKGVSSQNVFEQKDAKPENQFIRNNHKERTKVKSQQLNETKNRLLTAINKEAYGGFDPFGNTQALNEAQAADVPQHKKSTLSGVDPTDPGIDIFKLPGAQNWASMAGVKK